MANETAAVFIGLFFKSMAGGFLTVLTPFIYAVLPLTVGYLSPKSKPRAEGFRNRLIYAGALILLFTLIGMLLTTIVHFTKLDKFFTHWLFYFFLCRLFFSLGLSFVGAFDLKLPPSWAKSTASKARAGSVVGIFFMAVTLPIFSFSSLAPMSVLIMALSVQVSLWGPVIGLLGFSVGLTLPFVFPGILQTLIASKSLLNQVKVLLGFFALILALKFLSNADVQIGWHIIDRDIFIITLMLLSTIMGIYMLGYIKLPKDYASTQNQFGIEFVPLSRLFIAIAAFSLVVYLLPGMWGAPLHSLAPLLPPY